MSRHTVASQLVRRRALLGALGAAAMPAFTAKAAAASALERALQALVQDTKLPLLSAAALLWRDGRIVQQAQTGCARLAPPQPVTAHTLYRVASVSKLAVAVAVMRMVERGQLTLDADVGETLDFRPRHPAHPQVPITLRLLLSHRSGLSDALGTRFADGPALRRALQDPTAWLPQAPGRFFSYCNLGFGLIATVMEAASGQRFDRLMDELLLAPLGIVGGFHAAALPPTALAQLATLYARRTEQRWQSDGPWLPQADDFAATPPTSPPGLDAYRPGSNGTLFAPQGGLRISLPGLARLMQMLLDQGRFEGQVLLQPAGVQTLLTEHWRHAPQQANGDDFGGLFQAWGLGLQHFVDRSGPAHGDRLRRAGGLQAWGHVGDANGLRAGFFFNPARRWGMMYVINGLPDDPEAHPGRYSAFDQWEESLLQALSATLPADKG